MKNSLRWLIAATFIFTPINPYADGVTIYLWIPLIFLDSSFLKALGKHWAKRDIFRVKSIFLCIFLALAWCLLVDKASLGLKIVIISLGVIYLKVLGPSIIDKLYKCLLVSVIVCILQFILYWINPQYAYNLGPTHISTMLWGVFATPTFTNQYAVVLLPRMSGLSREAGFFVSLLAAMLLVALQQKRKIGLSEKILFFLAFLFSLSKATLALVFLVILNGAKRLVARTPKFIVIAALLGFPLWFASYFNLSQIDPIDYAIYASIAHRFSSAAVIKDLTIEQLMFGCDKDYKDLSHVPLVSYLNEDGLRPDVGVWELVVDAGLPLIILFIVFAYVSRISSYKFCVLILLTATVTLFTLDSFVILVWYYAIENKERFSYHGEMKEIGIA